MGITVSHLLLMLVQYYSIMFTVTVTSMSHTTNAIALKDQRRNTII